MLGFIKYEGRAPDWREEEAAAEGVDAIGIVVEADEKAADEEGVGRCPFPVTGCLSRSVPVWGNKF